MVGGTVATGGHPGPTTGPVRVPVVVVGAGLAGRMAAVTAAEHRRVVLVTDGPLARSNSVMAQGGLHVPRPEPGDDEAMLDDLARSARVPVDLARARVLVQDAADVTDQLVSWGLELDHLPDGGLRRLRAGGMSSARVLTIGDSVGPPLLALLGRRLDAVDVRTHTAVTDLRPAGDHVVVACDPGPDLAAEVVVVATGGGSWGHAEDTGTRTTNPRNRNHEFRRVLDRLGVATVDEDRWQYQPFGLVDGPPGPPARCVPETLASSGPRLLDRHGDELVALPADRLAITRAMFDHVDARGVAGPHGPGFRLTLSEVPVARIRAEYPRAARTLELMGSLGGDVLVMPFLHYQLGGVVVDVDQRTSVDRVLAAGEVTGGLHGRNRLMGAGVTEALVSGRRAGRTAVEVARG